MLTPSDLYNKYGHPNDHKNIFMWDVPTHLEVGVIPKRIYCNLDLVPVLTKAFKNLIDSGYVNELKTWDGCFNIRPIRGYENVYKKLMYAGKVTEAAKRLSVHSWGCAIDVNAFENGLGVEPKLSAGFVKCFTDAGAEWGGTWKRKDGMHFQLAKLP